MDALLSRLLPQFFLVSVLCGLGAVILYAAAPLLRRRYRARSLCAAWILLAVRLLVPVHVSLAQAPLTFRLPAPLAAVVRAEPEHAEKDLSALENSMDNAGQASLGAAGAPDAEKNLSALENSIENAGQASLDAALSPDAENGDALENSAQSAAKPALGAAQSADKIPAAFSTAVALTLKRALCLLWLAGALVLALYQTIHYQIWKKRILAENTPADAALFARWRAVCRGVGLRIPVFENHAISTPMLLGLRKPVLLVPCGFCADETGTLLLLHECEHAKMHDLWAKVLLQAAVCLHWPNPGAWLLRRAAAEEMELACDQAVLRRAGRHCRARYGEALLHCAAGRAPEPVLRFGGAKRTLRARLENLYLGGTRRGLSLLLAAALMLSLGASLVACGVDAVSSSAVQSGGSAGIAPAPVLAVQNLGTLHFLIEGSDSMAERTDALSDAVPAPEGADAAETDPAHRGMTDLLLYVSLDTETGKMTLLQIPRDTYIGESVTTESGEAFATMNAKLSGVACANPDRPDALTEVVRTCFQLPVDYTFRLTMDTVKELVDLFGGIEVAIPEVLDYNGSYLPAGTYNLSGDSVAFLLRNRRTYDDGDLGRLSMQRNFYVGLLKKLQTLTAADAAKLLPFVLGNYFAPDGVLNDCPVSVMVAAVTALAQIRQRGGDVTVCRVPVYAQGGTVTTGDGRILTVLQADPAATAELLNEQLRAPDAPVQADALYLPQDAVLSDEQTADPAVQTLLF